MVLLKLTSGITTEVSVVEYYTATNLTNLDTPEFVNGPVLCIIIVE